MKNWRLLILLCLSCSWALGQTKGDTIVFSGDGKIKRGSIPEVSTFPENMAPYFDTTAVKTQSSAFMNPLKQLYDSLTASKPQSYTSIQQKADDTWYWETFRQEYWRTKFYKELKDKIGVPLRSTVDGAGGHVLVYSAAGGRRYLPIESLFFEKSRLEPIEKIANPNGNLPVDHTLIRQNFDNQIIARHLDSTRTYYKGWSASDDILLKKLTDVYSKHAPTLDALLKADTLEYGLFRRDSLYSKNNVVFNIDVVNELVKFYDSITVVHNFYDKVLYDNQEWIKSWLWYTGGQVKLNPFDITDPGKRLASVDKNVVLVTEKIKILQSYIDCCQDEKLKYEKAIADMPALIERLDDLKREKEALVTLNELYKKWVAAHSIRSKVLYKYTWVTSTKESINWVHQYDAADKYRFRTVKQELPGMVAEMDQVAVLVHNVPEGDTVTLKTLEVPFQPKSKFEDGLGMFTGVLAEALKAATPIGKLVGIIAGGGPPWSIVAQNATVPMATLNKDQKAMADNLRQSLESERINKAEYVKRLYDNSGIADTKKYSEIVFEYMNSMYILYWLLSQTKPILSIDLKDDKTPAFRTEVLFPSDTMNSSKKVTYEGYINSRKKPDIKNAFTKYKLGQWLPTAGIAYVPANRTGSVYDEATGSFKADNVFDNFEALVGVKYYPWKTNTARDKATSKLIRSKFTDEANLVRGNSFYNTLFVSGGFGIRHEFLRNYYVGVGSDITPGLSWIAGGNFIFQKRYELENGQIKNQYERPKAYVFIGLSIDPNVVTNLLQLFR